MASGSLDTLPMVGNVAAAATLRNCVVNLHRAGRHRIQTAHIAIDVALDGSYLDPALQAAAPEEASSVHWELHTTERDQDEIVYRG
ncbi:hypothetical protein AB0O75_21860 [Streptomyces sp. NPDC088921]|uniref:hypothetical protein n=1 Tax=unclassified Streptomyces TaxID=2593676 RepID=UPI00343B9D5F